MIISIAGYAGQKDGAALIYIAGYAGQKDGAALITRLMDTIQKTAATIIEVIETRLLGEQEDSEEADLSLLALPRH